MLQRATIETPNLPAFFSRYEKVMVAVHPSVRKDPFFIPVNKSQFLDLFKEINMVGWIGIEVRDGVAYIDHIGMEPEKSTKTKY